MEKNKETLLDRREELKGMKVEKRSKTRGKRARRGFCEEYLIMTFRLQLTEHVLSTR